MPRDRDHSSPEPARAVSSPSLPPLSRDASAQEILIAVLPIAVRAASDAASSAIASATAIQALQNAVEDNTSEVKRIADLWEAEIDLERETRESKLRLARQRAKAVTEVEQALVRGRVEVMREAMKSIGSTITSIVTSKEFVRNVLWIFGILLALCGFRLTIPQPIELPRVIIPLEDPEKAP